MLDVHRLRIFSSVVASGSIVAAAANLGYTPFVHATIGEEITTWDYGHYNAYPLLIDPTLPNGGSTDWAVAEPPGTWVTGSGSAGVAAPWTRRS